MSDSANGKIKVVDSTILAQDLDNTYIQDNGMVHPLNPTKVEQNVPLGQKLPDTRNATTCYSQFQKIGLTPKQSAFLCAYIESCGVLHTAVEAIGINRWSHYNWLEESETYAQAFQIARTLANDNLLSIATKRAAFGVSEPHFYKDEVVGYIQKYSDSLMITLLKGAFPDIYGTERTEIDDKREKEILKRDPGREILTDERIKAMLSLADKAIAAGVDKQLPPGGMASELKTIDEGESENA